MIRELEPVDVSELARWISTVPFPLWPQQGVGRPAMVNDLRWCGFGDRTEPLIHAIMAAHFPDARAANRMLSVVMPTLDIDRHRDPVPVGWVTRVHVPLVGDAGAVFEIDGAEHVLQPGTAYCVDIRRPHAVWNRGLVARIHLMWDVLAR